MIKHKVNNNAVKL